MALTLHGARCDLGTDGGRRRIVPRLCRLVAGYDAASGTLRWSVAASGFPAVANGLVYLGLGQGIGAWGLSDGAQRWRFGTIRYGSPVVSGGRVCASGFTAVNGQPIEVVDQFRL